LVYSVADVFKIKDGRVALLISTSFLPPKLLQKIKNNVPSSWLYVYSFYFKYINATYNQHGKMKMKIFLVL
jgi:hypothetical protein